jgi:hypothetical protein
MPRRVPKGISFLGVRNRDSTGFLLVFELCAAAPSSNLIPTIALQGFDYVCRDMAELAPADWEFSDPFNAGRSKRT